MTCPPFPDCPPLYAELLRKTGCDVVWLYGGEALFASGATQLLVPFSATKGEAIIVSYGATTTSGASSAGLLAFRAKAGVGGLQDPFQAAHHLAGVVRTYVLAHDCEELFVTNGALAASQLVIHSVLVWRAADTLRCSDFGGGCR